MSQRPVWTQENPHHFALRHGEKRVDVRYVPAGFQSGWAVYVGSRMVRHCREFMQARGVALDVATGNV